MIHGHIAHDLPDRVLIRAAARGDLRERIEGLRRAAAWLKGKHRAAVEDRIAALEQELESL